MKTTCLGLQTNSHSMTTRTMSLRNKMKVFRSKEVAKLRWTRSLCRCKRNRNFTNSTQLRTWWQGALSLRLNQTNSAFRPIITLIRQSKCSRCTGKSFRDNSKKLSCKMISTQKLLLVAIIVISAGHLRLLAATRALQCSTIIIFQMRFR